MSTNGEEAGPQCWDILGKNKISLKLDDPKNIPYSDNIEMAGKRVAGIVSYQVDENKTLTVSREIFFPQLHEFKSSEDSWFHDYRAYLQDTYEDELLPKLYLGKEQFVPGPVTAITINGILEIRHRQSKNGLSLIRHFYPSHDERSFIEQWTIQNSTSKAMSIRSGNTSLTFEDYGAKGKLSRRVFSNAPSLINLKPDETLSFSIKIQAKTENEQWPEEDASVALKNRIAFLDQMAGSLQLETPDPTLNTLFEFSKIRASESIFESELGLIHSPGGGRYYVGIWANDQAEYVNPFFAFLGYDIGNISAMNTFRAFAKETNPEYKKIRYSFEIEGLVKPFLKDRGDAAMIAYGGAQYALATGEKTIAQELWPLIEWCLEYCHRQLNDSGVVASESDEMEGRIETGSANLSTSSLYYGALTHALDLGKSIKIEQELLSKYETRIKNLDQAIENYFGARVEGLETYKYYKEHKFLRHWICLPLVVGIHRRKEATIKGLFENLWTDNGVHVEKNSGDEKASKIFWDRGTLYALRGTLIAGATKQSLEKLQQFSTKRLLGNRVPYVVEAFPEGDMAHLSAESALYCRVFIEGLFGIKPTGLSSFRMTPRLPQGWDTMALNKIKAFGRDFDLTVSRTGEGLEITVTEKDQPGKKTVIGENETFQFSF